MGLPMTRFSLLSKLMRKGSIYSKGLDGLEEEIAKDIPRHYSLYAFVLCDHNDMEFRSYITDNFSRLDRRTDKNLLFISLVKPDSDVDYTLKKYYSTEEALTALNSYPIDDNLYQHALLEAFQVSIGDLPAIVLTTSLQSNEWYVIRVADASQCDLWLTSLRGVADDIVDGLPVNLADELNQKVSLNTGSGSWYAVEGAPVCDLLAAVESAAAMLQRQNRGVEAIFEEVCERLNSFATDDYEKKGAIVRLVKYLQAIAQRPERRQIEWPKSCCIKASSRLIETDTERYLKIFQNLYENSYLRSMEDHTVLCSLMHKIFESEINASLLQLMRRQIRIPMPEFYDKFFPDRKDCYVKNVNLNRYIKGNPKKHVSPGLGNACFAFTVLSEEEEFRKSLANFGISDDSRNRLIDLWARISEIRNLEAHCQVITDEHYHMMYDAVDAIMEYYLPLLYEIKQELRGRALLP